MSLLETLTCIFTSLGLPAVTSLYGKSLAPDIYCVLTRSMKPSRCAATTRPVLMLKKPAYPCFVKEAMRYRTPHHHRLHPGRTNSHVSPVCRA